MIKRFDFIQRSAEESSINLDEVYAKSESIKHSLDESSKKNNNNLIDEIAEHIGITSRSSEFGEHLFQAKSIYDFHKSLKGIKCTPDEYIAAFLNAAKRKREELRNFLEGTQTRPIANPDNPEFRNLLVLYKVRSWLVAIGILDEVSYDTIYKMSGYNFTHKENPNLFAQHTANYINGTPEEPILLVKNKRILSVGAGNGVDEKYFLKEGAETVNIIESSPYALKLLSQTRASIDSKLRNQFIIPDSPKDIISMLKGYIERNIKFDTAYCHSVLHYFDDPTLKYIVGLIKECLNENGHLSVALKAPGAILDGNGIPLINDTEIISRRHKDDQRITHLRGWLNNDTQSRFFRDREPLIDLICSVEGGGTKFQTRSDESFFIENYDTEGIQQFFRMQFKKIRFSH